jgi:hypothetical protein
MTLYEAFFRTEILAAIRSTGMGQLPGVFGDPSSTPAGVSMPVAAPTTALTATPMGPPMLTAGLRRPSDLLREHHQIVEVEIVPLPRVDVLEMDGFDDVHAVQIAFVAPVRLVENPRDNPVSSWRRSRVCHPDCSRVTVGWEVQPHGHSRQLASVALREVRSPTGARHRGSA